MLAHLGGIAEAVHDNLHLVTVDEERRGDRLTAEAPEAVTPQPLDIAMNATGTCTATLPAISWISVEFHG